MLLLLLRAILFRVVLSLLVELQPFLAAAANLLLAMEVQLGLELGASHETG